MNQGNSKFVDNDNISIDDLRAEAGLKSLAFLENEQRIRQYKKRQDKLYKRKVQNRRKKNKIARKTRRINIKRAK